MFSHGHKLSLSAKMNRRNQVLDDKDANLKKHISGATTTNDNPETYDYTRIYNHTHSYDIIFHNFRNSSTINFKLNLK